MTIHITLKTIIVSKISFFAMVLIQNIQHLEFFSSQHQKFNYYALQFPGSNLTKPVKNHKISVIYYAKLLIEFITKNNIKNITLIGKSMGASNCCISL